VKVGRLAVLSAWWGALVTAGVWVWQLDVGGGTADLRHGESLLEQIVQDPTLLAGHAMRAIALVLTSWLGVTTGLVVIAGLVGHEGLLRIAMAIAPGAYRRVLRCAAATTVTAGMIAGSPVLAAAATPNSAPVSAGDGRVATATMSLADEGEPAGAQVPTAVLRLVDDPVTAPGVTPVTAVASVMAVRPVAEATAVTRAAGATAATAAADEPELWTVRPGECFWSIAADVLAAQAGRPVADGEIVGYWQRLISANTDRLVVPGEPDLLLVGQQLTLPPTATSG
jgi:hypothetical protein